MDKVVLTLLGMLILSSRNPYRELADELGIIGQAFDENRRFHEGMNITRVPM